MLSIDSLCSTCAPHIIDNQKNHIQVYVYPGGLIDFATFRKQGVQAHHPAISSKRE